MHRRRTNRATTPLYTGSALHDPALALRGMPLPELCRRILAWSTELRPGRGRGTGGTMRRTIALVDEGRLPDHPTPADIVTWLRWLTDCGYSEGSRWLYWRTLGRILRAGHELGLSQGNPAWAVQLQRPAPAPHAIEGLDALLPAMLSACGEGEWGSRERGLIWVLRETGCRIAEALGLVATDVLPGRLGIYRQRAPNTWTPGPTKNGRSRRVHVTGRLAPILEGVIALGPARIRIGRGGRGGVVESPFLFPFNTDTLGDLAHRVKAAVPEGTFGPRQMWHAFRHTQAVAMFRREAQVDDVGRQLGHVSHEVTTAIYGGHVAADPPQRTREYLEPVWRAPPKRAPRAGGVRRSARVLVKESGGGEAPGGPEREVFNASSGTDDRRPSSFDASRRKASKGALPGKARKPWTRSGR